MKIYWRVEQSYRMDRLYRWWWWWRVWMIFKADNICINALPVENMHTSHLHSGPSGVVPSWEGASFLTLKLKAKTVKSAKKFSVDIETPSSGFAKLSWTKLRWAVKPRSEPGCASNSLLKLKATREIGILLLLIPKKRGGGLKDRFEESPKTHSIC